jgi:Zn-dependent oligopeptidase
MDPASATVAFVGFAASLATLVGLVIESAKTINDFCNKFERAPKDLQRFQSIVKQSNSLLTLLKDQTSQYADGDLPQNLLEYWLENVVQMQTDYEALKKIALKLQGHFGLVSTSKKHVRARIHHFFCSGEILELETRLSAHVAKFHLALTMIAQYVTTVLGNCLSWLPN